MASIPIPFSPTLPLPPSTTPTWAFFKPPNMPTSQVIRITDDLRRRRRRRRGLKVVTRAGLNANSYALAFLLPLSLLAATIFTSIRIADKLDEDYLEELEIIQAIKAAEEAEEEDDDSDEGEDDDGDEGEYEDDNDYTADVALEEELQPVLPRSRTRNRPKREA